MGRKKGWGHRRGWVWCVVVVVLVLTWLWRRQEEDFEEEGLWASAGAEAAFWSAERRSSRACPKVFVYELDPELGDWDRRSTFGQTSVPGVYATEGIDENANLLEVVLTRLASSERCSTRDASEAELFLVPVFPRAKHWSEWVERCEAMQREGLLQKLYALPHLREETARRHFFVLPRVGYAPKCVGWWTSPMPPLVRQFARVAVGGYEEFEGDFQRAKTLGKLTASERSRPRALVPRLVSAPYVASVRWAAARREAPPWTNTGPPRRFLFSYSGTPHGADKAVELRRALSALCEGNANLCAPSGAADTADGRLRSTLAKRNATFCLEPPGLTPGRASIVADLLFGCVPVLFAPEQDRLWPLHWGDWVRDSRLYVSADVLLENPNSLLETLAAVPEDAVARMRRAIADRAKAMQYATDDMPGDALEVLLRGLADSAASSGTSSRFRRR
ncbi:hypothetical protein CTAYLR_002684 [Chrysophaeum taylorii]|uniref:Exostosin GT47 domain-containing protein n=1 Tax=Chrysophaeum taylorii TaxID=2483200 RepID=A0AAD7UCF6_9STRA|nr:hypothetical protein CTAYLR_002684 [Chrysophaeum taylorii]